jgi:glycosyltransferase involved in cell wall biosynthesis
VTSTPRPEDGRGGRLRALFFESGRRGGSIYHLKSLLERLDPLRFEGGFVSWYEDLVAARLFEMETPYCRRSLHLRTEQPDTFKHAWGLPLPTPFALYYYLVGRSVLRRHRPDVAYMNTGIAGHEPVILAARRLGIPVVCHVRHSRALDADERRVAPWVERFVSCSRWGAQHLEGQLGRPASQIDCVYDGIDLSAFDARAANEIPPVLPQGRILVCLLGSLIPRKRPLLAIEALARARKRSPELTLVIAGDGPLRPEVERIVRQVGVDSAVIRLGSVAVVPALLRRCHIGLLVSESEGMPNAVMEYMAAGLAVVSSSVPGVGELVGEGRTGFIVPDATPAAVGDALLQLALSPARREAFGRAGREAIAGEAFKVESEARGVEDVLLRASKRAGRRRES